MGTTMERGLLMPSQDMSATMAMDMDILLHTLDTMAITLARGLLMLRLTMVMDMGMVAMDMDMDMVVMDTMDTMDMLARGLLMLRLTMVMDMDMVMDMVMDMDMDMVVDMDMDMVVMGTMDIMDMVMANRMLNVQELRTERNVKLDNPSHKLLLCNFVIVESKKC